MIEIWMKVIDNLSTSHAILNVYYQNRKIYDFVGALWINERCYKFRNLNGDLHG